MRELGSRTPEQETRAPEQEARTPEQEVKTPEQETRTPEQEIKTPETEIVEQPSIENRSEAPEVPPMTPEEIAEAQDRVIEAVEKGDIVLTTDREKGNFGEMKADQEMRKKGCERISGGAVTSLDEAGHQGLDGVYYNPNGKPPVLIVDAKYNKAQLHKETSDGPQLSWNWTDKRLDADVGKEKADEIRLAKLNGEVLCVVVRVAKDGDPEAPVTFDAVDDDGNITERNIQIQPE